MTDLLESMDTAIQALLKRVGLSGSTESDGEASVSEQVKAIEVATTWVQWRERTKPAPPPPPNPTAGRFQKLKQEFAGNDTPSRGRGKRAGNGAADTPAADDIN